VPYKIAYQPLTAIRGVTERTVRKETAAAALVLVDQLNANDETTSITDPRGEVISREELRDQAAKEAN
jgi:hypothetical protein